MQKCDIDWPICSHEPVRRVGCESVSTRLMSELCMLSLTGICDVEEERHRHY